MPSWIGEALEDCGEDGAAIVILERYQSGERMMTSDANALLFHLVDDEGWSYARARVLRDHAVAFSHG